MFDVVVNRIELNLVLEIRLKDFQKKNMRLEVI